MRQRLALLFETWLYLLRSELAKAMYNELTNLLPLKRQRVLSRDYLLRLSVVVAIFVCALTFISALLLLPTYVFLTESASTKEKRLAAVNSALATTDEKELSARLATLTKDATILTVLADAPSVNDGIRSALSIPRPGVTLSGFAYAPTKENNSRTLSLSGVAATRDALRSYQLALESAPSILLATLPVSAYAKDVNIAFTIVVTFVP